MISDFRSGLTFWLRGWQHLFQNRSLLAVAVIPLLISILFTSGFLWVIWTYLGGWVAFVVSSVIGVATGFWYDLLYYPLVVGGGVVVFIAAVYVSYILHALVAIPFYSALAERTLRQQGRHPQQSWRNTLQMFRVGLIKSLILLSMGLVLFVFSFIPVLNFVAIFCALLILAFDTIDYSFECMNMGLRQRFAYLFRHRSQWGGMAAGLALTLLLPGLTLLVLPGAVVGGALILKEPA